MEEKKEKIPTPVVYSSGPSLNKNLPRKSQQQQQQLNYMYLQPNVQSQSQIQFQYHQSQSYLQPQFPSQSYHQPIIQTQTQTQTRTQTQTQTQNQNLLPLPVSIENRSSRINRKAGGKVWEDPTLLEWKENDFRIFVGDLGNECNDAMLSAAFSKYKGFDKARVVRNNRSKKSRGYGFVSFTDPTDYLKALREMNGKYIGTRPVKLSKSRWKDREFHSTLSGIKKKKLSNSS